MPYKHSNQNILSTIGNTPLIQLTRITLGIKAKIFAKLEFLNPFGSIKDRTVKHMLETAENKGQIKPGAVIIENSSGNTALALAAICSLKGYHPKIVIRDNLSLEKVKILRSLNVELIKVDHTLPPESPDSYNNLAPRIAEKTPNSYYLNQHNNRENNEAHYNTTGPEIWEQMEGRIDYFIAGIGTGGTICGAGKYLKEKDPNIRIIAVDPVGSIFHDYFHTQKITKPSPYLIEGLGDEFLIGCADFSVIDDVHRVTDKQAFTMTRQLALEEAVMAGGSSGAALHTVLDLAIKIDQKCRIATIFPDSANRYLSTIYNDDWLQEKGFI
jgi:cystathionine beta-synthase